MKHMSWLLGAIYAVALSATPLSAEEPRVFTVDNNGGPHADFTDLQAAMDAAEDGDIYHVLGSSTSYGNVTVSKQVHLFGPGYNLARVYTEGYQSFYEATLEAVTIRPTPATSPAGSSISGFKANSVLVQAADVTVERNFITSSITISTSTSNGVILEQPHRARIMRNIALVMSATSLNAHNHLVTGNIFTTSSTGSISNMSIYNATFRHNYVRSFMPGFSHSIVENNILIAINTSNFFNNNNIRYNFFGQNAPNPEFTNFYSQNTLTENTWGLSFGTLNEFDALTTNTGAFDNFGESYQLTEDSLARGAGIDGVDLGPFAGSFPYEISGVPPLPRVKIMAPGPFVVSPSSDLEIPVKIILE